MATVFEWQLSHGKCPNGKCLNGKWVPAWVPDLLHNAVHIKTLITMFKKTLKCLTWISLRFIICVENISNTYLNFWLDKKWQKSQLQIIKLIFSSKIRNVVRWDFLDYVRTLWWHNVDIVIYSSFLRYSRALTTETRQISKAINFLSIFHFQANFHNIYDEASVLYFFRVLWTPREFFAYMIFLIGRKIPLNEEH